MMYDERVEPEEPNIIEYWGEREERDDRAHEGDNLYYAEGQPRERHAFRCRSRKRVWI